MVYGILVVREFHGVLVSRDELSQLRLLIAEQPVFLHHYNVRSVKQIGDVGCVGINVSCIDCGETYQWGGGISPQGRPVTHKKGHDFVSFLWMHVMVVHAGAAPGWNLWLGWGSATSCSGV